MQFCQAINEAFHQTMNEDTGVFLIGQGVKSPWYVGNTAHGLLERFGDKRVIDTPVSENSVTGAAIGAAMAGMRPIVVHPRMDFMMYALDPIINEAANWYYMNGGKLSAPVVIWGIINRGGEQAAQHSQALHSIFSQIPGLKVVMPSTPYDAKGLMIAAIKDPNPVVFIDDRWLYGIEDDVPEEMYEVEIGKAAVRREGKDITIVGISYMAHEGTKAADQLAKSNIDSEVIDLRSAKPLDAETIVNSVKKTGRLIVADGSWRTCGLAAEVSAIVAENAYQELKAPIKRVTLPDCPAPANNELEKAYYPDRNTIVDTVLNVMGRK